MRLKYLRRINHICKLGMSGGALAPVLLPEIRRIIPSYSATVLWVDNNYQFINIFDEIADDLTIIQSYLDEYLDNRDREARFSLSEWLKSGGDVTSTEELANDRFYRTDFYHKIMKPMRYHHSMYLALKLNAAPVGILVLHRNDHQSEFTSSEKHCLKELGPSISSALKVQTTSFEVLPSESKFGILIVDKHGKPKHISPLGRRLLFLATHPEVRKGVLSKDGHMLHIPGELMRMVRNYIKDSYDVMSDRPFAGWRVRNLWGSFVFNASWFIKPLNGIAGQLAITIQYQEPTLYRVMRRCEELGLTERQTEVSIGLFRGLSHEVISKNMCVSTHTVIDHAKKIYEKLGIQSKGELHLELVSASSI